MKDLVIFPVKIGHDLAHCQTDETGTWLGSNCKTVQPLCKWRTYTGPADEGNAHGVDCERSGITVVDVDVDDPTLWDGPETYTVKTPRGWHYYYLGTVKSIPAWQGDHRIQIQSRGKYVHGVGSYHPHSGYVVAHDVPMATWPHPDTGTTTTTPSTGHGRPDVELQTEGRLAAWAQGKMADTAEGGRNQTLFSLSCYLIEQGYDPELLQDAALATGLPDAEISATIRSAFKTTTFQPFQRADWWDMEPAYATIRQAAIARSARPIAALACALARVIASVEPHNVLPPYIGGVASLNILLGLYGPKGTGKGTAFTVAKDFVQIEPIPDLDEVGLASGEGLKNAYGATLDGELLRNRVMFYESEWDRVDHKMKGETSTLQPAFRSIWAGESVSNITRDPKASFTIPAHCARFVFITAMQPEAVTSLLGDGKGLYERFMFIGVKRERWQTEELADSTFEPNPWKVTIPSHMVSSAPVEWQKDEKRQVIEMPNSVRAMVRAIFYSEDDDAHAGRDCLNREKLAVASALLCNRDKVSEWDWEVAGEVLDEMVRARELMQADHAEIRQRAEDSKALASARAMNAANIRVGSEYEDRVEAVVARVMEDLSSDPANPDGYRDVLRSRGQKIASEDFQQALKAAGAKFRKDGRRVVMWKEVE